MARLDCIPLGWLAHMEWWLRVTGWAGVLGTCVPADAVEPTCAAQTTILSFVPTGHGFCVSETEYEALALAMEDCEAICQFVQFFYGGRLEIIGYDADNFCVLTDGDVKLHAREGDSVWVYGYDHEQCPPPDSVHIGEYPALRTCICPCTETTGDPCVE